MSTAKDDLWVKVLRSKYKCGNSSLPTMKTQQSSSNLWRGMSNVWLNFFNNVIWRLGRGDEVSFWNDHWIPYINSLKDFSFVALQDEELDLKVNAFVGDDGDWNWQLLEQYLPRDIVDLLIPIRPPRPDAEEDCLAWFPCSNGQFSCKSAYEACYATDYNLSSRLFRLIWSLNCPQRLRAFLWLVANNSLLTNENRVRRSMSTDSSCNACHSSPESMLHALRDCDVARAVWTSIDAYRIGREFSNPNPLEWLENNLVDHVHNHQGASWPLLFTTTLAEIWYARNRRIFDQDARNEDVSPHKIVALAEDYRHALEAVNDTRRHIDICQPLYLCWNPPIHDWIKLNTDGSVLHDGSAACGGLARDNNGKFLFGFAKCLGVCSITFAELWGIWYGLSLAFEKGFRRIMVEVDSKIAVILCENDQMQSHSAFSLVRDIHNLMDKDWEIHLNHTFRETNACADILAKEGHLVGYALKIFNSPPPCLHLALLADANGTWFIRGSVM